MRKYFAFQCITFVSFRIELEAKEEVFEEDDEVIVEEYLDEYFEEHDALVAFVDSGNPRPTSPVLATSTSHQLQTQSVQSAALTAPDVMLDHSYMIAAPPTFDGKYSSDEFDDPSDDETLSKTKQKVEKSKSGKPQKHKLRQLTGKSACKWVIQRRFILFNYISSTSRYCDTIFKSKESLKMHVCKYLQCDPKNFICRICDKELSKKTFSNHLHETLACQYCGKTFVNPRNMKTHIKTIHGDEKFIPPKSPDLSQFEVFENQDETTEPVLDETTGLLVTHKHPRKRYPRKTGRYECGK